MLIKPASCSNLPALIEPFIRVCLCAGGGVCELVCLSTRWLRAGEKAVGGSPMVVPVEKANRERMCKRNKRFYYA